MCGEILARSCKRQLTHQQQTDSEPAQGGNVYNDSRGERRSGQDFQRDTKYEGTHLRKHAGKNRGPFGK